MALPDFTCAVAFDSDPFDDPQVTTDVTAYLRAIAARYGRRSERDRADTGTSTVLLRNDDRRFDPENADGPYWPDVLPMRSITVEATLAAVTYPVFSQYVHPETGWPQAWTTPNYAEVSVEAVDGFELLTTGRLTDADAMPEQMSGARVDAVLDAIGWPAALRDIDAGQSEVQAVDADDVTSTDALALILSAVDTERGFFFIAPDGTATFHDRHRRLLAPYTTSQATFADQANMAVGRLPFHGLVTANSEILNDWRVTRQGGTEQTAEDAASIVSFRRRTRALSTIHTSDTEAEDAARFMLAQTKEPLRRFEELVIKPGNDSDLWEQVLGRELGDRITVIVTPPGGGDPISKQVHIESRSLDVPADRVSAVCRWRLSPAESLNYWVLGDAALSLLGETTVEAF